MVRKQLQKKPHPHLNPLSEGEEAEEKNEIVTTGFQTLEPPAPSMTSRFDGELLEVSLGPQHPSTHGVFRMNAALEGDIVRRLNPVFGYLHRNH